MFDLFNSKEALRDVITRKNEEIKDLKETLALTVEDLNPNIGTDERIRFSRIIENRNKQISDKRDEIVKLKQELKEERETPFWNKEEEKRFLNSQKVEEYRKILSQRACYIGETLEQYKARQEIKHEDELNATVLRLEKIYNSKDDDFTLVFREFRRLQKAEHDNRKKDEELRKKVDTSDSLYNIIHNEFNIENQRLCRKIVSLMSENGELKSSEPTRYSIKIKGLKDTVKNRDKLIGFREEEIVNLKKCINGLKEDKSKLKDKLESLLDTSNGNTPSENLAEELSHEIDMLETQLVSKDEVIKELFEHNK